MNVVTKLYIGCNDQDTKRQEKPCNEIKELIHDILELHGFNAYTLQSASGVFMHENGQVVNENTYIVTLVDVTMRIADVVDNLKMALNQESIMIEQYKTNIAFA